SEEGKLIVDGKEISYLSDREPGNLPWKDMNIDVVIESTGFFTDYGKAHAHIDAGARRVVITAPVKGEPSEGITGATVLVGVNDDRLKEADVTSNASCTTNAGA